MEQIVGLSEIREFRIELLDAVSKFEITEGERQIMRRVQSIKRDNMKWSALSNALNPTMLLTGGGGLGPQMAFQVLLTAARSAVEYKTMQGEQNIEELQAMWELRKDDMEVIKELRKAAFDIVYTLYNKYELKEEDRLTESTANLFNSYVSIADANKRVRVLKDNYEIYRKIPTYYYHLGMAYLDKGDYKNAKTQFLTYLDMYRKAPILRYDERSGCIALAMLANEKYIARIEKERLIEMALKNLPSNSAAVLQCAMVYIYDLKQYESGFQLLRRGIDDINATDRDILYMAIANLLPLVKPYHSLYKTVCNTLEGSEEISYDSYTTYLIYSQENAWQKLSELNKFSECSYRVVSTGWIMKDFNKEFHLTLPKNICYNNEDILVYVENHNKKGVIINQEKGNLINLINDKDIDDVKCFKANKNLKYLYVENVDEGVYRLRKNIDISRIKKETWPRQSEFVLSANDINDIVEFCEDNIETLSAPHEVEYGDIDKDSKYNDFIISYSPQDYIVNELYSSILSEDLEIKFTGDTLVYTPSHSFLQEGYYVNFILNNGMRIVYKYEKETDVLNPYFYTDGKVIKFANDDAQNEFTYTPVIEEVVDEIIEKVEEPVDTAVTPSVWSRVTGWFSSTSEGDSVVEEVEPEVTEKVEETTDTITKPSTWSKVKGWFSSTSENDSVVVEEVVPEVIEKVEETTDTITKPSTWSKVKGWFSSTSENDSVVVEEVAPEVIEKVKETTDTITKPSTWSKVKGWFSSSKE
ncbi:MAG: hypothetical protein UFP03_03975 [Paludibacteraceae bacterium]|nr:hypothetical protein [Paludibacteraceae bacterium]